MIIFDREKLYFSNMIPVRTLQFLVPSGNKIQKYHVYNRRTANVNSKAQWGILSCPINGHIWLWKPYNKYVLRMHQYQKYMLRPLWEVLAGMS